jgi:hypothetical protein
MATRRALLFQTIGRSEAFFSFMRDSGLPARPWDDQLMGMRAPEPGRTTGAFRDEIYAPPLFQSQSALLANAPNAPSWAPVVTQFTWRAHVAALNESTARRLLEATSALEARIAGQLEGESR